MTVPYTNQRNNPTFLEVVVDCLVTLIITMSVGFALIAAGGYVLKTQGITFSISIGAIDNTAICEVPVKVGGKSK